MSKKRQRPLTTYVVVIETNDTVENSYYAADVNNLDDDALQAVRAVAGKDSSAATEVECWRATCFDTNGHIPLAPWFVVDVEFLLDPPDPISCVATVHEFE